LKTPCISMNRGSAANTATKLVNRQGQRSFFLKRIHTGSGGFPGGKVDRAWSWLVRRFTITRTIPPLPHMPSWQAQGRLNCSAWRPSWKANSSSARQEIPRILWNPNVLYWASATFLSPEPHESNSHPVLLFLLLYYQFTAVIVTWNSTSIVWCKTP
jgi:hypothetical protein